MRSFLLVTVAGGGGLPPQHPGNNLTPAQVWQTYAAKRGESRFDGLAQSLNGEGQQLAEEEKKKKERILGCPILAAPFAASVGMFETSRALSSAPRLPSSRAPRLW